MSLLSGNLYTGNSMSSTEYIFPYLIGNMSGYNYNNLSDEIKEKIEEHKNEFETASDIENFIKLESLKA